jgi:glutamate racemase
VEAPIGVIDSGVGGLTVVKEMLNRLSNEPIIYIGDDARCPYGPRSTQEVQKFTMEMATALSDRGIKMLVIACNTATAAALDEVRNNFSFPVIGVIIPGARGAVKASKTGNIAVLGTVGTINSHAYDDAIHALLPDATVYPLACPDFVPIVENGLYKSESASAVVAKGLTGLAGKDFDVAILGCTHYPLVQHHIQENLPDHVNIISSAVETVSDVERILLAEGSKRNTSNKVAPIFYTTGKIEQFLPIVEDWLAIDKPDVRHIVL